MGKMGGFDFSQILNSGLLQNPMFNIGVGMLMNPRRQGQSYLGALGTGALQGLVQQGLFGAMKRSNDRFQDKWLGTGQRL